MQAPKPPLVGAQLLRIVPWQGVFVVQGALGLTLTAGVAFGLKESLPPARRVPFSLRSSGAVMRTLSRDGAFVGLTLTSALMSVAVCAYLAAASVVYQEVYGASPAVFGALILELGHAWTQSVSPVPILAGAITAGMVGYAALRLLMRVVRKGRFYLFAPYCWLAGLIGIAGSIWL